MVAVLVVAIVAVLEVVQAVLGAWLVMDTAIIVQDVMGVMVNWLVVFHVMKALVVSAPPGKCESKYNICISGCYNCNSVYNWCKLFTAFSGSCQAGNGNQCTSYA